ncbi:hypothetical protein GGF47_004169 [Coemansia sp. RSA 2524]|nr:hypothetical protein GGF47_004169 [Coemansia sp. RSA 2524]
MTIMESTPTAEELAHELLSLAKRQAGRRLIVAVSGTPGSGKSLLSARICAEANRQAGKDADVCTVLPMDGFHLSRAQLLELPDPDEAQRRRGAHWTFDAESYVTTMQRIRDDAERVLAPMFDHAHGDPVADSVCIEPWHRIVMAEGLYAHVGAEPWAAATQLADELWWIQPRDAELTQHRLVQRHLDAGLAHSETEAELRILANDSLNAAYSSEKRIHSTRTILN